MPINCTPIKIKIKEKNPLYLHHLSPPPSIHIQGNLLNFPPSDVALLAWQVNGFSLNISYLLVFCYSTTLIFKNFLTLPDKPENPVLSYTWLFLSWPEPKLINPCWLITDLLFIYRTLFEYYYVLEISDICSPVLITAPWVKNAPSDGIKLQLIQLCLCVNVSSDMWLELSLAGRCMSVGTTF